ncbi:hypothetical protein HKX41_11970, partial [Salinisphaera sp. USBA-960]|nr:hypothetical protein [Salifodinibacter halophilus]
SEEIPSYGKRMDDPLAARIVAAPALLGQWSENTFDVSAPIKIGQQRLGGVRVGYDLKAMRAYQDSALEELRRRLDALGRLQLLWVGL